MQILMDGVIPPKILINLLSNSLQSTSNLALDKYKLSQNIEFLHMSYQIWNPLLEVTLRDCRTLVSANGLEKTSSTKPSKHRVGSISAAFEDLTIQESQVQRVRQQLKDHGSSAKRPFTNKFHKHIDCSQDNCKFCVKLFHSVNITKCVGHKPCHKTGFYPHIGQPLWCMLKNKHNKSDCNLLPKPCKPGEIKALNQDEDKCEKEFSATTSWADECSNAYSDLPFSERSNEEKEEIYYPTVKKRKNPEDQ